ncbi:SRPBCC family protein [Skermanella stibiiresistens]|uniref:SRPBCC family protein n=1 Tax=Skermanella stibiiresistens TaxID=913326 RepID=UPI0004B0CF4F|nr:SRPBCC family protein [Skermanella stibiiresistens]
MRHIPTSLKTPALAAALILLSAAPSLALDAAYRAESASPPAAVWSKIGDFCGIAQWHPAVESCALSAKDGATLRTLALKGGGAILEKLEARDDAARSYSYSIISSPLPVRDYQSVISVVPTGSGSAVVWTGKFNARDASDADALKTIEGIYKAGADVLVK